MELSSTTFDPCSIADDTTETNPSLCFGNSNKTMHTEKAINYEMYGHGSSSCSKIDKDVDSIEISNSTSLTIKYDEGSSENKTINPLAFGSKSNIGTCVEISHLNDVSLSNNSIKSSDNSITNKESLSEVSECNRIQNSNSKAIHLNNHSADCTGSVLSSSSSIKHRGKTIFWWKNKHVEPRSTTALILEDRPRNLPDKNPLERQRHHLEYRKMVQHAKQLTIKDEQKRRKTLKAQERKEEAISSISSTWLQDILPHWNTMYQTIRVRQLWWEGLPPCVRGKVWKLAIGNELNITADLYDIMVTRAHEKLRTIHETQSVGSILSTSDTESLSVDRESTVELIRLDISRTFPKLVIFQKGGPYHELLHDILGAYACYRPDVGYVQGMSFIAAMLLLNMEPAHAFVTFANILNKPCQVAFFRLNEELMKVYFAAFEVFFEENLPKLFAHFKLHNLTPDMFLIDWLFTMFSKSLCLDTTSRIWDVFCRDGEEFLFKTAIGILTLLSEDLLKMEFIQAAQILTKLPSSITCDTLFLRINQVSMVSGGKKWKDVLTLLMKEETG